ncbi:HK97 family phage prohead protease [Chitinophaga sp.]|uniref:HK97 family phage prohead protease n=1 Tax=Chitinophaga sp. TaxID=1869181 RepID=UPI0031CE21BF
MKKIIQYKTIKDGLKDLDTTSRTVKIAIASFGDKNLDRDKDILLSTAVTKTIKERGPQGTNEIWHLADHWYDLNHALSKFSELYVEGEYLIGVSTISKTTMGNNVLELYGDGHINQHSIGFSVLVEEYHKEGEYNLLKEIALWEGSSVLWGANPNTPTMGVQKSMNKEEAFGMLNRLTKSLRNGTYTDDMFSLFELQCKQLQQYINDLEEKSTAPAQTTQPDTKAFDYSAVLSGIKSISQIVKN